MAGDAMSRLDGGSAFPSIAEIGDIVTTDGGMTLRDYFAMNYEPDYDGVSENMASAVGLKMPEVSDRQAWLRFHAEYRAKLRYIEADAMLTERLK
jgi:hypothetical protein